MKEIPSPSKKRLILLSQLLSQLDKEKITSVEIQKITGWGEATVRRDISCLELHNGVSNGYDILVLKKAICERLGLGQNSNPHKCCIVGLGSLGAAFLENSVFNSESFNLVAAFDSNQNKIDVMKSKIPLYVTLDLEKIIRQKQIEFAILAVPDEKAQFMTDRLVKYGIKGIVNYTNVILSVPENVKLENASPEKSLSNLI